jgi:hypothetical protein
VNDARGRPFFVVERVVDAGLLEVLRNDIVPRLLKDVPHQPSEQELADNPYRSRFTLVFDREGYSPEFFRQMWQQHRIACITYHKHPDGPWPEEWFREQSFTLPSGETVTMALAERGTLVGTAPQALWMREVRKLTDSGHQVSLIGTAFEGEHTGLAASLFSRWCQENFFRYMMQHFALDLLAEYGTCPMADTAEVVNPAWRRLSNQKQSVQSKLVYRQARFAELALQEEDPKSKRHVVWLQKKASLLEEIQCYEQTLADLKSALKQTPRHIQWKDLPEADKFNQLLPGRKRLLDTVRMIAYRAETAMIPMLMSETVNSPDARAILQALFLAEADILPEPQHERLRVQVHRSSCPVTDRHRQRLFEMLNQTETNYPGTNLRLIYEMVGPQPKIGQNGVTANSQR